MLSFANHKRKENNTMSKGFFIVIIIAAVVLLIVLFANKDLTVGADITAEEVTEFVYTLASSTYPPDYQRYRFYEESGRYWFWHEKREGNKFPLTESDITVSGTLELSEAEWAAFLGCLEGGKVQKRSENTETGRSGPALYLYWTGDRSKYQQFSFSSLSAQTSFEEFCAKLAESDFEQ